MRPFRKVFLARMCVVLGADLRRAIKIGSGEDTLMLLLHPFQQVEELTKSNIEGVPSQHSSTHTAEFRSQESGVKQACALAFRLSCVPHELENCCPAISLPQYLCLLDHKPP
jgi:hypothetical protein